MWKKLFGFYSEKSEKQLQKENYSWLLNKTDYIVPEDHNWQ